MLMFKTIVVFEPEAEQVVSDKISIQEKNLKVHICIDSDLTKHIHHILSRKARNIARSTPHGQPPRPDVDESIVLIPSVQSSAKLVFEQAFLFLCSHLDGEVIRPSLSVNQSFFNFYLSLFLNNSCSLGLSPQSEIFVSSNCLQTCLQDKSGHVQLEMGLSGLKPVYILLYSYSAAVSLSFPQNFCRSTST